MHSRAAVLLVVAVLAIGLAAGVAVAQRRHTVAVGDNFFEPASIEVTAGDTVVWTHAGEEPHTVTADDDSFDSHPNCPPLCMQQGDTFEQTFTEPGQYPYHCRLHGEPGAGMAGVVVVTAAPPPPAPESQPESETAPAPEPQPAAQPHADTAATELPHTGAPLALPLLGASLLLAGALVLGRLRTAPR